jgi:cell division protease FtsH
MSPDEKRRVAYHEGGHTILGLVVPGADPVNRVTIVPRGQALGVTYQRPEEDRHNYEEGYLRARIIGAMGGRAAEELVYGTRTTGAESDMQQATELARQMVTRWGMSEKLGPVTLSGRGNPNLPGDQVVGGGGKPYSETFATLVDTEVQRILQETYAQAVQLLDDHRGALDALAQELVEREMLDEQEVLDVTGLARAPRLQAVPRELVASGAGARA